MEKSIYSAEYKQFIKLLRTSRERSGLTQQEIAVRLKSTQTIVSKCERGERRLDVVELKAWCYAIGITLNEFLIEFEEISQKQP
jgi:transcriptional regulator with XRE-family HTH domain